MTDFENPFRPGAGHTPPYLAGRQAETSEVLKLISRKPILENMVLTGLRGVGKTVLMESFRPLIRKQNWLWVGADLSESTSVNEKSIATRICTDLALITTGIVIDSKKIQELGFSGSTQIVDQTLDFSTLCNIYDSTPGLSVDKLKAVIETAWTAVASRPDIKGIIFAYDEAQNLSDRATQNEYPLSLLLDTFQSLQRKNLPVFLLLTGLPTLFPKLVEARTYTERMFRVVFLQGLTPEESKDAVTKPIEDSNCPIHLNDYTVDTIVDMSGGYPYFIQFICREVFDAFIVRLDAGEEASVPTAEIEQKLDTDFFSGRWAKATDRQRELMSVIANLPNSDSEFTVQEIAVHSKLILSKPFSSSHINQILTALSKQGLVFKNRHGKYSFAVPLLGRYIERQDWLNQ